MGSDPASSAHGPLFLQFRCPRGSWEGLKCVLPGTKGQETHSGLEELLVPDAREVGSEGSWAHGSGAGQVGPGEFVVQRRAGAGLHIKETVSRQGKRRPCTTVGSERQRNSR